MNTEKHMTQNRELRFTPHFHFQTAASVGFCKKWLVCAFSISTKELNLHFLSQLFFSPEWNGWGKDTQLASRNKVLVTLCFLQ